MGSFSGSRSVSLLSVLLSALYAYRSLNICPCEFQRKHKTCACLAQAICEGVVPQTYGRENSCSNVKSPPNMAHANAKISAIVRSMNRPLYWLGEGRTYWRCSIIATLTANGT